MRAMKLMDEMDVREHFQRRMKDSDVAMHCGRY